MSSHIRCGAVKRDSVFHVFFANNFDTFSAGEVVWFHDEDVTVAVEFSLLFPSFESLRENVGAWTNVKFWVMFSAHFTHVTPQTGFITNTCDSNKMIYFLIMIQI